MQIPFYKYEGAGNDFVMIDNRGLQVSPGQEFVKRICDRHFGIGADGMILLEEDGVSDFSMRYYNADGNEGTMCGNGGRCITLFANQLGLIESEARFSAIDGGHQSIILNLGDGATIILLKMNDVENIIEKQGQWMIDTGSPHLVIPVDNLDEVDVYSEGRKIRYSPLFADEGINVNFVKIANNSVWIRTYERGVENETLACGTGAVAAAITAFGGNPGLSSPVHVEARGGLLKVHLNKQSQKYTNIWLEGPAKCVFKGEINIDFLIQ